MNDISLIDSAIRRVPDFPKPGILFYDITGLLVNPDAFAACMRTLESLYSAGSYDTIAAIESRGFIFAAPLARKLGLPMVLVRKKGKLPGKTLQQKYTLEYGEDIIEVHQDDVKKGARVLIIDDLVATGGTLKAACELFRSGGADVVGVACVVGLPFLGYGKFLDPVSVKTVIDYHAE